MMENPFVPQQQQRPHTNVFIAPKDEPKKKKKIKIEVPSANYENVLLKDCLSCHFNDRCRMCAGITSFNWGQYEHLPDRKDIKKCHTKLLLDEQYNLTHIPDIYRYALLKYLDEDNSAYKEIQQRVNTLKREHEYFNYILTGAGTGTGKTFAACVLLNEFVVKKVHLVDDPLTTPVAMYVDFSAFMQRIKASFDTKDEELSDYIENVKTCELLIIDDVLASRVSDYDRDVAFVIFNERFLQRKSTILISNLNINRLRQDDVLTERVISRMLQNCTVIDFAGNDKRKEYEVEI